MQWFGKRRTAAMVWLIRTANGALTQSSRLDAAFGFLLKCAKRAVAFAYLLDVSHKSRLADEERLFTKRCLIVRSLRGRRHILLVKQTAQYLADFGKESIRVAALLKKRGGNKKELIEALRSGKVALVAAKKVTVGMAYRTHCLQKEAFIFLQAKGQLACRHGSSQEQTFLLLAEQCCRMLRHSMALEAAQSSLKVLADKARDFSTIKDSSLQHLLLRCERAFHFCDLKDAASDWLERRSLRAKIFLSKKALASDFLRTKGILKLNTFNSASYLHRRVNNAILLLYTQESAASFLREKVPRAWKYLSLQNNTQKWLRALALRSLEVTRRRQQHSHELLARGKRALIFWNRVDIAGGVLRYVGRLSRLNAFADGWVQSSDENAARMKDELQRLDLRKKALKKERSSWTTELQDKTYLRAAFEWYATLTADNDMPQNEVDDGELYVCLPAFLALFSHGKVGKLELEKAFAGLSAASCGSINFITAWNWYWLHGTADMFSVDFNFEDIVSLRLQAAMILFRRFVLPH